MKAAAFIDRVSMHTVQSVTVHVMFILALHHGKFTRQNTDAGTNLSFLPLFCKSLY